MRTVQTMPGRPSTGGLGRGLAPALWALAGLWMMLAACNRIHPEDAPQPGLPDTVASLHLRLDTAAGQVAIPLAGYLNGTGQPFTLMQTGFRHGRLGVEAGRDGQAPVLLYVAADTSRTGWQADTGTMEVCQAGQCRRARIYITNPAYRLRPVVPAGCQSLPGRAPIYLAELGTTRIEHLADGFAGAAIDSVASLNGYAVSIGAERLALAYTAASSSPLYTGYDEVFYRLRLPDGSCASGLVDLVIGDTCEAHARPDALAFPTAFVISIDELLANDTGCDGRPGPDAQLRLSAAPYARPARVETGAGSVTDTLIDGQPALYYRKRVEGAASDTFTYYLVTGPDAHITRARVRLGL